MAEYYIAPKSSFDATADAIREKTGSQATIEWTEDGFADAIEEIPSGGGGGDLFDYSKPVGAITSDILSLPPYAIAQRTGITSIELTNGSFTIGTSNFRECTSVQTIKTPGRISSSANYCFYGCTALQGIVLVHPDNSGRTLYNECFRGCSALSYLDTNSTGSGQSNVFYGCTNLSTLVLRKNGVFVLGNINHFTGTPFASGGAGGTIYIPKALYDHLGDGGSYDYKAATNWSTIDGYGTITWAKIEGSQYENYYADGTPIPTT